MDKHNPAFSGFFDKEHKRIDLVLVISDRGNQKTKEKRINYLTNLIKFGLELELDQGTMFEHRNLVFVKVHAPDSIIEEYGIYFNVRKFFKDDHVEYIYPFLDPLGMKHERELIQLVREQYPGPVNYSTLERSKIVYNIVLRLPYEQNENGSGISRLLEQSIILDAFALHDGPHFLVSGQDKTSINARQTLFYNWVGIVNIWRTQPVYMIQEYLGEEVSLYFAYYEYFNLMLILPAVLGLLLAIYHYNVYPKLDPYDWHMCHHYRNQYKYICPQCRYFDLCPFRLIPSYCTELQFIAQIDTPYAIKFGVIITLWSIIYVLLWKRREKYLTWMWEVNEKYHDNLIDPEYRNIVQNCYRSYLTGVTVEKYTLAMMFKCALQTLLFAALFTGWLLGLFTLSIQIWYVKFYLNLKYHKNRDRRTRHDEHLFIAIGALVNTILISGLKVLTEKLSLCLTSLENNKKIGPYNRSFALKLYGFHLTGTFALLTFHIFIGNFYYTHILDMKNWYSLGGWRVMTNRLGSSWDDMCITLAVIIVVEQILRKIPSYLAKRKTDHEGVLNRNAPSWEREYKLDTIQDNYFHKLYNDIAIQFSMATLFSITFTLAPFFILLVNVWDIRYKAKIFLLTYRRPLLLKAPKPALWHKIIFLTSFIVPIFNTFIIGLHSRYHYFNYEITVPSVGRAHDFMYNEFYHKTNSAVFFFFDSSLGEPSPKEEFKKLPRGSGDVCYVTIQEHYYHRYDRKRNHDFYTEFRGAHVLVYRYEFVLLYTMTAISIFMIIYFYFPIQSTDIEETLNTESRIKQKYYVQKGLLPQFE